MESKWLGLREMGRESAVSVQPPCLLLLSSVRALCSWRSEREMGARCNVRSAAQLARRTKRKRRAHCSGVCNWRVAVRAGRCCTGGRAASAQSQWERQQWAGGRRSPTAAAASVRFAIPAQVAPMAACGAELAATAAAAARPATRGRSELFCRRFGAAMAGRRVLWRPLDGPVEDAGRKFALQAKLEPRIPLPKTLGSLSAWDSLCCLASRLEQMGAH